MNCTWFLRDSKGNVTGVVIIRENKYLIIYKYIIMPTTYLQKNEAMIPKEHDIALADKSSALSSLNLWVGRRQSPGVERSQVT